MNCRNCSSVNVRMTAEDGPAPGTGTGIGTGIAAEASRGAAAAAADDVCGRGTGDEVSWPGTYVIAALAVADADAEGAVDARYACRLV
jgi:hypothetical protein